MEKMDFAEPIWAVRTLLEACLAYFVDFFQQQNTVDCLRHLLWVCGPVAFMFLIVWGFFWGIFEMGKKTKTNPDVGDDVTLNLSGGGKVAKGKVTRVYDTRSRSPRKHSKKINE
jgi:hypothetical protein